MTSKDFTRGAGRVTRRSALGLLSGALMFARAQGQTSLQLPHGYAPDGVAGRAAEYFAQRLARSGAATVEVLPRNRMMSSQEGFELVSNDKIDAWMGAIPASNAIASLRVFDVPFLIRDTDHLARAFDIGLSDPLKEAFAERGMRLVAPVVTGTHGISSAQRPVEDPGALEGLKLSISAGRLTIEGFSRLGASVVRIPTAELYPASQAGFLDAVAAPLASLQSLRLYETHRYLSLTRHVYGVAFLLVSRSTARRLGERQLDEIGRDITFRSLEDAEASDRATIENLAQRGMEVVDVDAGRFEYTKKLTYDLYLNEAPEAWNILSLVEKAAF